MDPKATAGLDYNHLSFAMRYVLIGGFTVILKYN